MKRKINWKSGVGELLGFACVIPFLTLMICAIFSAAQITLASERMLYACYSTARAAVVSADVDTGKERSEAVFDMFYDSGVTELSFVEDKAVEATKDKVTCAINYVNNDMKWKKGSIIKCTVSQYITPLMPFTAGVRSQTLSMMIENGDGKTSSEKTDNTNIDLYATATD